MKQLILSENGKWASTVTQADNGEIYIFARGKIDWREANALLSHFYDAQKRDPKYLDLVAARAKENNFEVEIKD